MITWPKFTYKALYGVSLFGYFVVTILFAKFSSSLAAWIYAIALLPFTMISICAAIKYKCAPKTEKKRPSLFAASTFSIHPYVTTGVLVILNFFVAVYSIFNPLFN